MSISKSLRFSIFERDGFTCQYCGKTAQDGAELEVDHITPTSGGGKDTSTNLLTSCQECNAGKGPRLLAEAAPSEQLRAHLEYLASRRKVLGRINAEAEEIIQLWEQLAWQAVTQWNEAWGIETNESGDHTTTRQFFSVMSNAVGICCFEDVLSAIHIARSRCSNEKDARRYFCGVLRNKKQEREGAGI